jgi:hypothetical protein
VPVAIPIIIVEGLRDYHRNVQPVRLTHYHHALLKESLTAMNTVIEMLMILITMSVTVVTVITATTTATVQNPHPKLYLRLPLNPLLQQ